MTVTGALSTVQFQLLATVWPFSDNSTTDLSASEGVSRYLVMSTILTFILTPSQKCTLQPLNRTFKKIA